MSATFPQLRCSWRGTRATWTGPVQPTALSREYIIRVVYSTGEAPKVVVLQPLLQRRSDGSLIPHVYPGDLPCLYLPRSGEWLPTMAIGETIIPWVCLWLFHYELWHATGNWFGGGIHPTSKSDS